jgi:hypothetical protein
VNLLVKFEDTVVNLLVKDEGGFIAAERRTMQVRSVKGRREGRGAERV